MSSAHSAERESVATLKSPTIYGASLLLESDMPAKERECVCAVDDNLTLEGVIFVRCRRNADECRQERHTNTALRRALELFESPSDQKQRVSQPPYRKKE